jgi:NAD(P)-dependent dehydrogenase (short-subunit alcohol dehydrogenase family)
MTDTTTGARRTAFITGASSGIGAAAALALARDNCDVAISATRVGNLAKTTETLGALGVRVLPVALDLRSQASIEQSMQTVVDAFGHLDILVNNAAGVLYRSAAVDTRREDWDAAITTLLTGPFFMCQQMARHLLAAKRPGCIINVGSTHGLVGFPGRSAYGISKAGIMHMTRMLAIEWAGNGIRVNAVAPGSTATEANASLQANPKILNALLSRIPLRRVGSADEIASAVCYLARPEAAYVTGQTLVVDGGLTSI